MVDPPWEIQMFLNTLWTHPREVLYRDLDFDAVATAHRWRFHDGKIEIGIMTPWGLTRTGRAITTRSVQWVMATSLAWEVEQ